MEPTIWRQQQEARTQALEQFPDVRPMVLPGGQVLLYAGHEPPGIFVVVRGTVRVDRPRRGRYELDAREVSFCLPEPRAIDDRARDEFSLAGETHLLYVPRSALHDDPDLRAAIEALPTYVDRLDALHP